MNNYNRDLLLMYRTEVFSDDLLQHEVECLHNILRMVECNEIFCRAHELVTKFSITSKPKAIVNAIGNIKLKPFYFLLNKN